MQLEGIGWSCTTRCAPHQCRDCSRSIRATTIIRYLGCKINSLGNTHAEAQMKVTKPINAQTRYSCGLLGASIHRTEHQNQAAADAGSKHVAVLQQKPLRGFRETWKRWKSGALRLTARSPVHMSRERTQDLRKRLGVHAVVSTLQVRRPLWAKKWLREEAYPWEERTGAGEAMSAMVFGRLSFEKGQAPPSRFVRQFLEDMNDLRRFVCDAEEGDRAVEDARAAAGFLGIDLPRENPSRDQKWLKWLLAVPATNIRMLLSYATRADLCPGQQLSELDLLSVFFFFEKSTCSAVATRGCHSPHCSISASFSALFWSSCRCNVEAFFMSVDFSPCRSHEFSRTCSSKSLPGATNVSSQA